MPIAAQLNKEQVVDAYSRVAPVYDLWGRLTETKARRRAMALASIRDGEHILEVAVGTGLTFAELLKVNRTGQTTGVDLTPAMLARARQKAERSGNTNYRLTTGDAYALDFPDGSFDLLINNYMFDLLPETDFGSVLHEFKRVLKPGGRVVLTNMTEARSWPDLIWKAIYRINPAWLGGCRGVELTSALQAAGFTGIKREILHQFGFPSEILTART